MTYGYDSLNRPTGLANTVTGNFGFGYDVLGRRTSLTRPNNVDTAYSYDSLSRLLSVLHNGGYLPGSTSYTYDAAGNRTSKTALQQADPTPVSALSEFSYDNIYQLTQTLVDQSLAESYTYDAVGNRLTSISPASYTYNSSNQLTASSAATYTYDYNGNTLTKTDTNGTTYYTWDYENRLTQVMLPGQGGTVYFNYDPFGRRVRKILGSATTIYAYDGDSVIEELDGFGSVTARYTQGAGVDEPLAMYRGLTTVYFHADGLGSVTSLTDGAGGLAASYVYDSFGKLTASTGTLTNPFQYTGREFDAETGLYYHRARYYDPSAGRFLSEDPVGFWAGFNFYAYVHSSPTNLVDPTGLKIQICSRGGWQEIFPFNGIANHVYFLDPRTGRNCGRGSNAGKEDPSSPGTNCVDVPNSENREDDLLACCWENHSHPGFFWPKRNDCHNFLANCLKKASLPMPQVPGGRWGARCLTPACQAGPSGADIGYFLTIVTLWRPSFAVRLSCVEDYFSRRSQVRDAG